MPNPPNDPHANDPTDRTDPSRPEHRTDPSRKGSGPNNPLPGEPGGPTTSGFSEADRKAAEEGQRHERENKDKDHKGDKDHSKR